MPVEQIKAWLIPSGLIAFGAALGLVSERIVLPRLGRRAAIETGAGRTIFISSIRGMTFMWWIAAGAYAAALALQLPQTRFTRVEHLLLLVIIPSVTVVFARIATAFVTLYSHDIYRRPGGSALPTPSIVTNLTNFLSSRWAVS
jgi:hypothetical protein